MVLRRDGLMCADTQSVTTGVSLPVHTKQPSVFQWSRCEAAIAHSYKHVASIRLGLHSEICEEPQVMVHGQLSAATASAHRAHGKQVFRATPSCEQVSRLSPSGSPTLSALVLVRTLMSSATIGVADRVLALEACTGWHFVPCKQYLISYLTRASRYHFRTMAERRQTRPFGNSSQIWAPTGGAYTGRWREDGETCRCHDMIFP